MRFAALWLAGALVVLAGNSPAAPIPKGAAPAKPAKLTPELLQGSWKYEWSGSLDGHIEFDAKESTYTAQHSPNSTTYYSGTFAVGENSITIVEWGFESLSGRNWGPTVYRFDVDVKGWPVLAGKTTGGYGFNVEVIPEATMPLKLSERK